MGTVGAGIGGIYSSFANQKPYIERLFEKIKTQIIDFSNKYPTEENDSTHSRRRSRVAITTNNKNTLDNWIDLWLALIILDASKTFDTVETTSGNSKEDLINKINSMTKDKLKNLEQKNEFDEIYKEMQEFVTWIEKPKNNNYKLPYVSKISKISKNK